VEWTCRSARVIEPQDHRDLQAFRDRLAISW
jgi:hypothetical protein